METLPLLRKEFETEAQTTKKFLALLPEDKWEFKPHEKSMSLMDLVTHIADLPSWAQLAFGADGLDFASQPYNPVKVTTAKEVTDMFDKNYETGKVALQKADESILGQAWTLRNGDTLIAEMNRYETVRVCLNQTTHHRAQLGVYYRLLGIALPGSYGPTADESF